MEGYRVRSVSRKPSQQREDGSEVKPRGREAYPGGRSGWLDKGMGRKGGEEGKTDGSKGVKGPDLTGCSGRKEGSLPLAP